jgi:hypothetical protein
LDDYAPDGRVDEGCGVEDRGEARHSQPEELPRFAARRSSRSA